MRNEMKKNETSNEMTVPANVHLLHLEFKEYVYGVHNFGLRDRALKAIAQTPVVRDAERISLFGRHMMANAMRQISDEKEYFFDNVESIAGMVQLRQPDCVIYTEPAYCTDLYASKVLYYCKEKSIPVVFPFDPSPDIAFIIESMPRSGTHYLYDNIVNMMKMNKANVNEYTWGVPCIEHYGVHFTLHSNESPYAVFSHLSTPVRDPRLFKNNKTIYLFSYFFDQIFSYCWAHSTVREYDNPQRYEDYKVQVDSVEWQGYRKGLFDVIRWLTFVKDQYYLTYESIWQKPEKTKQSISEYLGIPLPRPFTEFKPQNKRCYWHDNYAAKFDEEVFKEICTSLRPFFEKFYPEKLASLNYE